MTAPEPRGELGVNPLTPFTSEASWFCCGAAWGPCGAHGGGACGTCKSGSMQCAWPNASAACFNETRPDTCGDGLARLGCGHGFSVTGVCSGTAISVSIADCGPNTQLWCGEQTCCNGTCGTDRLIDLTPAAFSAIASLSSGRTAVSVHS